MGDSHKVQWLTVLYQAPGECMQILQGVCANNTHLKVKALLCKEQLSFVVWWQEDLMHGSNIN